jgi:hypothetical protein
MARAGTPGAWFRGLRVMALDGLVFGVPDTPANDEAFARGGNDQAKGPFPGALSTCSVWRASEIIQCVVEVGTAGPVGWFRLRWSAR